MNRVRQRRRGGPAAVAARERGGREEREEGREEPHQAANAAARRRACSAWCAAGYPSAGLERSGRAIARSVIAAGASSRPCRAINFLGPPLRAPPFPPPISRRL